MAKVEVVVEDKKPQQPPKKKKKNKNTNIHKKISEKPAAAPAGSKPAIPVAGTTGKKTAGKKPAVTAAGTAGGLTDDLEADKDEARLKGLLESKKVEPAAADLPDINMSLWGIYGLHQKLLDALKTLKFTEPTEIQQKCFAAAIEEKR